MAQALAAVVLTFGEPGPYHPDGPLGKFGGRYLRVSRMKECPFCSACYEDDLLRCPEDGSALDASLEGPALIDQKYLLLRCLGKGGMGAVYLARHRELRKQFALKLIRHARFRDPQALARFRVEAKALGLLQHPHIVEVTDFGVDPRAGGLPYLVMEHLRGRTLQELMREEGPQDPERALALIGPIAGALDYAHDQGVLHRDLNPKNVFLARTRAGEDQVKILDFGLARIIDEPPSGQDEDQANRTVSGPTAAEASDATQTLFPPAAGPAAMPPAGSGGLTEAGTVMGTPGYIAPEILRGHGATRSSDVYSLGVIIYELLSGKRPHEGSPRSLRGPDLPAPPSTVRPSIPADLDQAILDPLASDAAGRPGKAMDLVGRLRSAFDGYRYRVWRARELPRRAATAVGLTLILILLFFALRGLPVLINLENALADLYFRWLPSHLPAGSLLLVSFDEATLQSDPALLVDRADEMGLLLQRVFNAGARGIALDFLLPESWGRSESFARLILLNQDRFILASYIKEDGRLLGTECLNGLVMAALGSEERAAALFGFLNVPPDRDGRIRRVDLGYDDPNGRRLLSMPVKAYRLLTSKSPAAEQLDRPLRLDFSTDWTAFRRISWKDLSISVDQRPDVFLNKMVFIGGEYEGSQDLHRIPKRPGFPDEISGLLVQALALDTLIQNTNIRQVPAFLALLPPALLFLAFSALLFIRPKAVPTAAAFSLLLLGYISWAIFSFIRDRQLVPIGTPLAVLLLSLASSVFIRRKLTFLTKPRARGRFP